MIPVWFIKMTLIFLFGVPLLALCLFFLIAAEIMTRNDKMKEEAHGREAQHPGRV